LSGYFFISRARCKVAEPAPLRYHFFANKYLKIMSKKYSRNLNLLLAVTLSAVLLGAGCREAGNELGNEIVTPVAVPVAALNQAKSTMSDAQAVANLQAESVANEVTVAMVLTEGAKAPDGAKIGETFGCNDQVAYVKAPRESDSGDTLRDVLNSLFAQRDPSFAKLYNSLAMTSLTVDKIQSTDGVTTEVWLKGTPTSGGTCDDPRIRMQIEATIKRLKPKYKIFLNGSESEYNCIGNMSGNCK
jgi:hypothetical protein